MIAGSIPALGTDAKQQRLGRQLADHLGLEPGMLWVRLPPEPLTTTRPRGAARSARHPVKVEAVGSNPIGDAYMAWYANWQSDGFQKSVIVGSTPTRATDNNMRRLGIGVPKWL